MVHQGYPFLEAARAALVTDELVIADGWSTDGAWEALNRLREAYPSRVQLSRDAWPGGEDRGRARREVTNLVRRRASGDWCWSIQVNEIVHEASIGCLRALPSRHTDTEVFALPYLGLMGPRHNWKTTWRRRLFKNIPDIVAVGDAFDVSPVLPRHCLTVRVTLPKPIDRYRGLFPVQFVEKLRSFRPMTSLTAKELALAEAALVAAERPTTASQRFRIAPRRSSRSTSPSRRRPRRCTRRSRASSTTRPRSCGRSSSNGRTTSRQAFVPFAPLTRRAVPLDHPPPPDRADRTAPAYRRRRWRGSPDKTLDRRRCRCRS